MIRQVRLATLLAGFAAASACVAQQPQRVISVSGKASINVPPERVSLSLEIWVDDKAIEPARAQGAAITQRVNAALLEAGIEQADIQMEHLSIGPQFSSYQRESLIGYRASRTLRVTLQDPARVEEIVAIALHAGANTVNEPQYLVKDPPRLREQAREMALKAAREKAEKMAAILGQRIGKPVSITETSGSGWSWGEPNPYLNNVAVAKPVAVEGAEMPPPDSVEVSAQVAVAFELVD